VEINVSNQPGTLYVIATPIGNLEDLSPRALRIFTQVKYVAAEDTRHSKKLFDHYDIAPRLISHHKFNEHKSENKLIKFLKAGDDVALISDAGTPLISDPGAGLVRLCHFEGIKVIPIPGPSALICALSAAGLATDKFVFEGFLAEKHGARLKQLRLLAYESRTVVFYETPHRILDFLHDLIDVFGTGRRLVVAREITKKFETIKSANAGEVLEWIQKEPQQQKGEFVVMVEGRAKHERQTGPETEMMLRLLLTELPLKKAASIASKITGESKNAIYTMGLELQNKK
jgi:16S rRNA (cytidine1402-2'-O)-methyltransferase